MSAFDLQDLGMAYRKAKVDLYYSSHPRLTDLASYEENLHANLTALLAKINSDDETWAASRKFIGKWTLAAKSLDMESWKSLKKVEGNGLTFSSPSDEWEHVCTSLDNKFREDDKEREKRKPKVEFRVMADCSIDFHVLSTLWMLKVGHLFDAKLTDCAYGNRMRRKGGVDTEVNELSLGTFKPYLKPFRDWRDNGIEAMQTALNAGKKIVALTADITSYYHELSPRFMREPTFLRDVVELRKLSTEEKKLHVLFINALEAWALATPLKRGLPVGLPASAIVANVALVELDRIIEREVAPLYYGRYVDDILLVMENGAGFGSSKQLWNWLFARSNGNLSWGPKKEDDGKVIAFQPCYFKKGKGKSQIQFANSKNKVFLLAGETGKTLVDAIANQIHERSSEWRAMPRLPRSDTHVGTDLLAATQSDGEAADNLRKTDALTMRRAGFAIKLRDFEAYERDLHPIAWRKHRQAFFGAYIQHVMVLPQFFDLVTYLPRVIRLATACEDFAELRKILNALNKVIEKVEQQCLIRIKACDDAAALDDQKVVSRWRAQLLASALEAITAAFPPRLSRNAKLEWDEWMEDWHDKGGVPGHEFMMRDFTVGGYQAEQAKLFAFDLAHLPFRFIGLPQEMVAQRGIPAKKTVVACNVTEATEMLSDKVMAGSRLLASWVKLRGLPHGILFATRPFNLPELFILNGEAYAESQRAAMRAVVLAVRGFNLGDKAPVFDKHGVLQISDGESPKTYSIAVSSWKTNLESWVSSVMEQPDPNSDRYSRLCRLIDGVISQPHQSRYLILPELALPAHWFIRIARKLHGKGISLIAGIQYLHVSKSRVRNQVWASLSHEGLGFPSLMVYRQDKQRPALHEEQELHRLNGLKMQPANRWKPDVPPIVQHGDFRFALLVCSELTNIGYRAGLRGKVDALFVPEWNQDTETFNALVESAALDMHAYIIQCNDRQYGDSRIRGPFKESWKRDVLRVKGGVTDYCVIGEIDVKSLRQFQSSNRSPSAIFKPVPDGFEVEHSRKVLPKGDAN
ncbi:MAG: hypothetical protein RL297_2111 [Pseudomonadota bacterium]|jgi:hypothetical protein